jgi:hypothetical protein
MPFVLYRPQTVFALLALGLCWLPISDSIAQGPGGTTTSQPPSGSTGGGNTGGGSSGGGLGTYDPATALFEMQLTSVIPTECSIQIACLADAITGDNSIAEQYLNDTDAIETSSTLTSIDVATANDHSAAVTGDANASAALTGSTPLSVLFVADSISIGEVSHPIGANIYSHSTASVAGHFQVTLPSGKSTVDIAGKHLVLFGTMTAEALATNGYFQHGASIGNNHMSVEMQSAYANYTNINTGGTHDETHYGETALQIEVVEFVNLNQVISCSSSTSTGMPYAQAEFETEGFGQMEVQVLVFDPPTP